MSDYIEHCKDAFLISEAKRYNIKGKHYFDYPNKYYFTDNDGIIHCNLIDFLLNEDALPL